MCRSKAKNAQEAHEAVRPTKAGRLPDQARLPRGSQLASMYTLVWARAVASQMSAASLLQVPALLRMQCQSWLGEVLCVSLGWRTAMRRTSRRTLKHCSCPARVHSQHSDSFR